MFIRSLQNVNVYALDGHNASVNQSISFTSTPSGANYDVDEEEERCSVRESVTKKKKDQEVVDLVELSSKYYLAVSAFASKSQIQ